MPSKFHLAHTKRFILWFRENVIMDPSTNKNIIEKNLESICENQKENDFGEYYNDNHDFSVCLF